MEEQKTESRPWGSFTIIDEGPGFKVKRIEVNAGNRLSLQSHERREEYWTFVRGTGVFTVGEPNGDKLTQIHVSAGQQVKIPKRAKHRIEALDDLAFIEVQLGDGDESDITRYEDDYGRAE